MKGFLSGSGVANGMDALDCAMRSSIRGDSERWLDGDAEMGVEVRVGGDADKIEDVLLNATNQ